MFKMDNDKFKDLEKELMLLNASRKQSSHKLSNNVLPIKDSTSKKLFSPSGATSYDHVVQRPVEPKRNETKPDASEMVTLS